MAKILVERPRFGGGYPYPRGNASAWRRVPLDDQPRKESIKFAWRSKRKDLNENLAPLRRFLKSKVGQSWDKVYSEICERINRDSPVQLHIWQHLMWEVQLDPIKIREMLRDGARSRWGYGWLYVDPDSGILRQLPHVPKSERWWVRRKEPPFLVDHEGRRYRQIQGIWYEIELVPLPASAGKVWDAILSRMNPQDPYICHSNLRGAYGESSLMYAKSKRQLNTKEIKHLLAAIDP